MDLQETIFKCSEHSNCTTTENTTNTVLPTLAEQDDLAEQDKLLVRIGDTTDIGGGRVNQDDSYTIECEEFVVTSVIDGHGEDGELIANMCKTIMERNFAEHKDELLADPVNFLHKQFVCLHDEVTSNIVEKLRSQGTEVVVDEQRILQKEPYTNTWVPMKKGGATKSIILLIKSTLKLYIANVGDSEGILCCNSPVIRPSMLMYEKDSAPVVAGPNAPSNTLILTGDHSPSNKQEYYRMRSYKCLQSDPNYAEMRVIYDKNGERNKSNCLEVFDVTEDGVAHTREPPTYSYFKNMRKERATYVLTPPDSSRSAVLSVTRSIGDNMLQQYGVTCCPEIQSIELSPILDNLKKAGEDPILCVVLATDGVWDNWQYSDMSLFVLHESCVNAVQIGRAHV